MSTASLIRLITREITKGLQVSSLYQLKVFLSAKGQKAKLKHIRSTKLLNQAQMLEATRREQNFPARVASNQNDFHTHTHPSRHMLRANERNARTTKNRATKKNDTNDKGLRVNYFSRSLFLPPRMSCIQSVF